MDPAGSRARISVMGLDGHLIARVELAEMRAWEDMYAAAPADFAERHSMQARRIHGATVLGSRGLALAHFNSVLGFGTQQPAGEAEAAAVLDCLRAAPKFYFHTIAETQGDLERVLETKGLRCASSWDRVVRDGSAFGADTAAVEEITEASAAEWAEFIDGIYGLTTGPWLRELAGRPGWSHFALREAGSISAARSMYIDDAHTAWFGIDAPVPGIMTNRFDRDRAVCAAMITAGLSQGVTCFAADIEVPSVYRMGPGYDAFSSLGFEPVYRRNNWTPAT